MVRNTPIRSPFYLKFEHLFLVAITVSIHASMLMVAAVDNKSGHRQEQSDTSGGVCLSGSCSGLPTSFDNCDYTTHNACQRLCKAENQACQDECELDYLKCNTACTDEQVNPADQCCSRYEWQCQKTCCGVQRACSGVCSSSPAIYAVSSFAGLGHLFLLFCAQMLVAAA